MKSFNLVILSTDEIEKLITRDENDNVTADPPYDHQIDGNDDGALPPMFVLSCNNVLPEGTAEVVCGHDDFEDWYFWWTRTGTVIAGLIG